MYIKIYFADKPLFLCNAFDEEINAYVHHDDAVFIDEFSSAAVNSMLHEMRQEKVHAGIFYHTSLEELKKAFWRKFVFVQAGGGLVENEKREILFIYRRRKWDLPKGKLDKGEKLEECAIREVKEETGLKRVRNKKFLTNTYHTYDENGKHMLKDTAWYLMQSGSDENLSPQTTEQITELKWVSEKELAPMIRNTYGAIVDVLRAAAFI